MKEVGHLQAQIQTLGQNMENQHAFLKQVEQHLQALDKNYDNHQVFLKQVEQHLTARVNTPRRSDSGMSLAEAATPPVPAIPPVSVAEPPAQSAVRSFRLVKRARLRCPMIEKPTNGSSLVLRRGISIVPGRDLRSSWFNIPIPILPPMPGSG